jgi:VIT1/CCC1 family predicted Fe2+/Mn2+ transporter
MAFTEQRSLSDLVSDAVDQFTKLIRNEMAIARADLSAKASEAMTGIALLVGGAVLLIPALVLLLMALSAWLNELGLRLSLANLIAAVVGILISAVLAYVGKSYLSSENLKPKRTIREFERDVAAVRKAQ